jgi:hypothetical protein
MAKVVFGNHSSVLVPQNDRDGIRKFYCDVLGGKFRARFSANHGTISWLQAANSVRCG